MAVTFTCRLLLVRTESGKLKLKYGHLDEDCVRPVILKGPDVIIPPTQEMTEQEYNLWEYQRVKAGFGIGYENTSPDDPLVVTKRTYEDVIPKGSIRTELYWVNLPDGRQTLGVRVTNGWNRMVPNFSLANSYQNNAPQPDRTGNDAKNRGSSSNSMVFAAMALGGSEAAYQRVGMTKDGDLAPQKTVEFTLDPRSVASFRSRTAALSPENYWISLLTDGREFDRIPGKIVGAFLDEQ